MKFEPGFYYIGDPGFVLPVDDIRTLFSKYSSGILKSGVQIIEESLLVDSNNNYSFDEYWIWLTKNKSGTLFDQYGKGWGFDWGCFGIVPWKWVSSKGNYSENKIEFKESFECFYDENTLNIGHFKFDIK